MTPAQLARALRSIVDTLATSGRGLADSLEALEQLMEEAGRLLGLAGGPGATTLVDSRELASLRRLAASAEVVWAVTPDHSKRLHRPAWVDLGAALTDWSRARR